MTRLVSCLMPTARRPEFARIAIAQFLQQHVPTGWQSELLIVDEPEDSTEASLPKFHGNGPAGIRVIREPGTIGHKRNFAVGAAWGDVLLGWDDDDFYSSDRIEKQIAFHCLSGAKISLLSSMIYWEPSKSYGWEAHFPSDYGTGGSFCVDASFAKQNPYPELSCGEDDAWLKSIKGATRIAGMSGVPLYVMQRHGSHTSTATEFESGPMWRMFGPPDGFRRVDYSEFEPIVSRWAPRPQQAA